ncbi:MAG: diaminopimelate epimerase [Bdellovibrio sp.]|nr:diaminopimelate epimerase [Bdellovibrio sp.]
MSLSIPFVKMHGLGNDFVVLDSRGQSASPSAPVDLKISPKQAQRMCDRRFGIGADQILWLKKPLNSNLDVRMEILNADGSVAEMCGNGIRAISLYLFAEDQERKTEYSVETLTGVQRVTIDPQSLTVCVDMGLPKLGGGFGSGGETLQVQGQTLRFFEVNVGNPHALFFVDSVDTYPVEKLGPLIEVHPRFPQRTNVEFIEVVDPTKIKLRVWERGAGITLACGSGACASAVGCIATSKTNSPLEVELPGGTLNLSWNGPGTSVFMRGPDTEVFRGVYSLS